jgi:hypothetical protein
LRKPERRRKTGEGNRPETDMRTLPVLAAFNHVLRSTINNLGFAWHLSWPWMIVIMPLNILAGIYGFTFAPDAAAPSGEVIALTFPHRAGHDVRLRLHCRELASLHPAR